MPLYSSQQAILDEVQHHPNAGLFLGCGAGKTHIGASKMMSYQTPFNLVVCQKSGVSYWINHFQTYYPEVTVTDLTKIKSMKMSDMKPGVMVINYDLIWRRPILSSLKNFTLMLDESSMIQNMQAKRTKFILKLKPTHVILLSGTPISGAQLDKDEGIIYGKYENLLSQLHLLGWKITKKNFWDRYIVWELRQYGEVRVQEVTGYKNIKELNSKLKSMGCVFRRTSDMVDLPDYADQTIYVNPIPEYKKMKKDGIVEVDGDELIGDLPITKLLRLRQLCAQYNHDKISVLTDLLESLENERVVIFYSFIPQLEQIRKAVGDRPLFQINGETKDFDEATFGLPENSNAVVAAQYIPGSRLHNMQASKYIIYMNPTQSAEEFDQSRGRIRRNGQKADRVMYYHIIAKDTVEEKILSKVRSGVDYTLEDYQEEYEN